MALGLNKILISSSTSNTPGSYFQPVVISSIGVGNASAMNAGTLTSQFVPAGMYIMPVTAAANVAIEVNVNTNSATVANTWVTYISSNSGGTVFSDGFNVRANATVSNQSLTLWTVNGGNAVVGTFLT